ncbi:MAG TPA: hypothetical protein PKC76_04895 [Saprospiraceae bacterium]|nr:hypothetical protein [Saprospiraceae bacterium]HMP23444.1 hypothetical protein [Saprospiraceae bacterium]
MASELKEKVSFLEETLNRFIINSDKALYRLSDEMQSLSKEMKAFKNEMKEFKDEMKEFKDEMKEFKDEMKTFKDEMKEFKDEMKTFKDFVTADIEESRRERREMNKRWGDIANRLGTFAEDIAAPNLPRIAKELFGEQEELYKAVRLRAQYQDANTPKRVYEFDGVLETERKVFLLECKSYIRMDDINAIPKLAERFLGCFPLYREKELITVFASMSIPDNVLKKLTTLEVYAMAMGDDNMNVLNFEAIQNKKASRN